MESTKGAKRKDVHITMPDGRGNIWMFLYSLFFTLRLQVNNRFTNLAGAFFFTVFKKYIIHPRHLYIKIELPPATDLYFVFRINQSVSRQL